MDQLLESTIYINPLLGSENERVIERILENAEEFINFFL
jgi:hypothetical protein